jgi:hypothetical protein
MHGAIELFILFIGLRIAWQLTASSAGLRLISISLRIVVALFMAEINIPWTISRQLGSWFPTANRSPCRSSLKTGLSATS